MSDTPRLFTTPGGRPVRRAGRRGRGRRRVARALVAAIVAFFGWALWISRDTHPVEEFVPASRQVEAILPHAAVARARVGASHVWDGVPQEWIASAPAALADRRGLPDWVVGNLVGGSAMLVADDAAGWTDAVFISRMTRAGCVIERALRWRPANRSEWAGGLRLRYWEPGRLYYAARGRTLLASPSRDALVSALTLTPERRVPAESVRAALSDTGAEDARGTWTLSPEREAGRIFDEIRFAVRVDQNESTIKLRARFRPEVRAALSPYWGGVKPVKLAPVFEGPLAISAELGGTVEQNWRALAEVVDVSWLSGAQWDAWRREEDGRSAAAVLTRLLGPAGPSVRVTWQGIDLGEMSPVPVLVVGLEGDRKNAQEILDSLPKPDATAAMVSSRVTFDAELGQVEAPLMSGPSMTPMGRWEADGLYFSTSALAAPEFFESGRNRTLSIEKPANLYVRIDPAACVGMIVDAGRELAAGELLRGYTPESFEEAAAIWRERAAALEYVEGSAIVNDRYIEADFRILCRAK